MNKAPAGWCVCGGEKRRRHERRGHRRIGTTWSRI